MEVAKFNQADQFLPGRSAYECGFYATYVAKSMGKAAPTLSPQEIADGAQSAYARYNGSNVAGNDQGMSLPQLYALLKEVGLHYQGTKLDLAHIRAWLASGYPVIVAVAEPCVRDLDLNDTVPYPWTPTGNHVIVLTGLDGNNFLARDTANIVAPNTLRPGPRRYDAAALARGLVSATAVVPSWLPIPTKDIDPNAPTPPASPVGLSGWKDDGTSLNAPNGKKVVGGFRHYVMTTPGWSSDCLPMEDEHPMDTANYIDGLGTEGAGQLFRDVYLRWTKEKGVWEVRLGSLLSALVINRNELAVQVEVLKKTPVPAPVPIVVGPVLMTPELLQLIAQVENSLKPLSDLYSVVSKLKGN